MFVQKLLVISAMLIGAQCRYVYPEMEYSPEYIECVPGHFARVTREVHGGVTVNSDGTSGAGLKVPLIHNDKNELSAIGSADFNKDHHLARSSVGLNLANEKGHSLSLLKTNIPGREDQLKAAGTLNLLHNDNHNLDANVFATRHMPKEPSVPNFNTVGGGLDYMYKDKIGASASAAHTDFFDRNDYNVGGKLNLYKDRSSSLDFNAGWNKFDTPHMSSGWEPTYGFSYGWRF
ncbi:hypothetical protein K1T71_012571 [Dendrolimus kikuchii]|uniref:Uncharacterized protein n=1 Tax=Dendrolimus kikuchii TaxID=765133 RepID=A0ACC1CJT3_9NEOP|nr:hypothetical protein K1T71_012571 [Dendrolimus kikuchii]